MVAPDYRSGSLVNVMRSIETALGDASGVNGYAPHAALAPGELAGARHVVLVVIDGLGAESLRRHVPDGALAAHLRASATSVFPSTTASAVTTMLTGDAPRQHALTGWYTWFREIGTVGVPLPFRTRAGGVPLERLGIEAPRLLGTRPLTSRLRVRSHLLMPARLVSSAYTRAHRGAAEIQGYADLAECFARVASLAARRERSYVYAYWPELDTISHDHGSCSPRAVAHLREIDALFAGLLEATEGTGTALVLTADHGFVDTTSGSRLGLGAHPEIAEALLLPPCGEPRTVWCYVRADRRAEFPDLVRAHLGDACRVVESAALVEEGWFGLGPSHPELGARIGDFALMMSGNHALWEHASSAGDVQIGVHGGTSESEMRIPLVVRLP